MMDLHDYKRKYERRLERIKESNISKADKEWIYKFNNFCVCNNISVGKIDRYLLDIEKFIRMLKKPIVSAKKEDIMRVVAEFNQSGLSEESKKAFKIMLRRLYKIVRGIDDKKTYPEEVAWISIGMPPNSKKLPEELLTEEEMMKIINYCKCQRDKALIACLCESGCRIGEVGTMQIKHVSFEEHGARITVNGKTGMRKILVINSAPYLQEWINQHPYKDKPDSPLWYNPQKNGYLKYTRISKILKQSARDAGIKKKIYPHLLRHSRATSYASIMSDSSMKHYFGWTQGSKMASIYIHMSGKETDEAILIANGLGRKDEKKESPMKPLTCARCHTQNEATNKFCRMCSLVLSKEAQREILVQESTRIEVDSFMNQLLKNKEVIEFLSQKIKEVKV